MIRIRKNSIQRSRSEEEYKNTHDTGIRSTADCGKICKAKNLMPTKNDGANISFPAFKNSDSSFLSKHLALILNVHLITFSVVNRTEICEKQQLLDKFSIKLKEKLTINQ